MPESMEEFVAHENIRRLEKQISITTSGDERALLLRLISEQKQNLGATKSIITELSQVINNYLYQISFIFEKDKEIPELAWHRRNDGAFIAERDA
jgi:hypothetical protein